MDEIRAGMEVVARDGKSVGRVKDVGDGEVLIDRSLQRDAWIPLEHVTVLEGRIGLDLSEEDLDAAEWSPASLVDKTGRDNQP